MNTSEEFPNIYMNFIEKFLATFAVIDHKDVMTVMTQKKLKN